MTVSIHHRAAVPEIAVVLRGAVRTSDHGTAPRSVG